MKIVITGGSRGIGRMLAEHLKFRHEIFIISNNPESLSTAKKSMKVEGFCADVSDFIGIRKVFGLIKNFEVLINCAGILGPVGFLGENSMDFWEKTLKINLIGTVNTCKASLPFISRKGRIINIAGGGAAFPRLYHTAYASSKAAVVRFTETFAKELEEKNSFVKVNVIAPGAYRTDLWKGESYDQETKWADPKDLFSLIDFLIENNTLNGKFIHIRDDKQKLSSEQNDDDFTLRRIDNIKFGESK